MTAFAQLFFKDAGESAVIAALDAVLRREGYAPFDAAKVPARYPAMPREFLRVALAAAEPTGIVTLLVEDWDRAFGWSLDLSKQLPGATVLTFVRPPFDPTRTKAWRDAKVVLKVGDDPDAELAYNPPQADRTDAAAFVASWGAKALAMTGIDLTRDVQESLPIARVDAGYREAVAGTWPVPLAPRLYASVRSRLYLEA